LLNSSKRMLSRKLCNLLRSASKCPLQYYLKTGTCKYGSTCKYHHPRDRNGAGPVSFNALGLPMRQVFLDIWIKFVFPGFPNIY